MKKRSYQNTIIKVSDLCKSFDNNVVLKNINFELLEGESLAIIGDSGSCKSVLLKNIIGLLKPEKGSIKIKQASIEIDGEEYIDKIDIEDPFSDIGYDIIVEFMTPNLLFDRRVTISNQRLSIKQVPRSKGVVLERELIVDANIRITEDVLQKLNSLTIAIDNQNKGRSLNNIWNYLGRVILLSIVISLFFTFKGGRILTLYFSVIRTKRPFLFHLFVNRCLFFQA